MIVYRIPLDDFVRRFRTLALWGVDNAVGRAVDICCAPAVISHVLDERDYMFLTNIGTPYLGDCVKPLPRGSYQFIRK